MKTEIKKGYGMELIIKVPIREISKNGWTSYDEDYRSVQCFAIHRSRASKTVERYYYTAHYIRAEDEIFAYNNSSYGELHRKNIAYSHINRKLNPKFNPKKLDFINDICKTLN